MNKDKLKKWQGQKDQELQKEIDNLQHEILISRIDIANRKTKGIQRIRQLRRDIARIKTILTTRILYTDRTRMESKME